MKTIFFVIYFILHYSYNISAFWKNFITENDKVSVKIWKFKRNYWSNKISKNEKHFRKQKLNQKLSKSDNHWVFIQLVQFQLIKLRLTS